MKDLKIHETSKVDAKGTNDKKYQPSPLGTKIFNINIFYIKSNRRVENDI